MTMPPQHPLMPSVASMLPTAPGTAGTNTATSSTATTAVINPAAATTILTHLQAAPFFAQHVQQQQQQQQQASENNGGKPKLRSGKWVAEEEAYANLLIEAFEKGVASDCTNGSTLRSYLATKLQCAPMRISKKFAGKGIGKMVYLSKMTRPEPALAARLMETEQKFQQAIFPVIPDFFSVRVMIVVRVCCFYVILVLQRLIYRFFWTFAAPCLCESRPDCPQSRRCSPGFDDASRCQATDSFCVATPE